jgi:hypothetical protein
MAVIKKRISDGVTDKRRRQPVDELRAKVWRSQLLVLINGKTDYALGEKFGGDSKKWNNYKKGSQPNDLLLSNVESLLPGSTEIFTAGPNKLKLWPSLTSNDLDTLLLISEYSERVDGLIAQFRLDAINELILSPSDICIEGPDNFELRLCEIFDLLYDEIGSEFTQEAMNILTFWLEPFVEAARHKQYLYLLDDDCNTRANSDYTMKIFEQEKFNSIELPTVKQKGHRSKLK